MTKTILCCLWAALCGASGVIAQSTPVNYDEPHPFGTASKWAKDSDNVAIGKWWQPQKGEKHPKMRAWIRNRPRDQVLAFALYTHDHGVLKLTAQCFPLMPYEPKTATLELQRDGQWQIAQEQNVVYPGWSIHFRIENWDNTPRRTLSRAAGRPVQV